MKVGNGICRRGAPPAMEGVPEDLREWFSEGELVAGVLAVVAEVGFSGRGDDRYERDEARCSARTLVTVLTYAYGMGMYDSQGIEEACRTQSGLLYLTARRLPSWESLRWARRRHRRVLHTCLTRLLDWALRGRGQRARASRVGDPGGVWSLRFPCLAPGATLRERLEVQAEERISRATLEDTVAADI